MAEREALTAEYVRSILNYDPETGVFTWRERPLEHFKTPRAGAIFNARFACKVAGYVDGRGYWRIGVGYRMNLVHRLAWLWMTGKWPDCEVDHVNGDPDDNRWVNHWCSQARKWRAKITVSGKEQYLGIFDNIDDAAKAYASAAKRIHGEFARPK